MKRDYVAVLAAVLAMVSMPPSSCSAATLQDWQCVMTASGDRQDVKSTSGLFAVSPSAADGYDALDRAIPIDYHLYVATYHSGTGDGWEGTLGFYRRDYREPIFLGQTKTWIVYVWADTALPALSQSFDLDFGFGETLPAGLRASFTLLSKPVGITSGPALGTVWDLSAQPRNQVQLPVFRISDGREGYVFDFTATVIPEPSSLLALLTGLAGLGAALRRQSRG